jgi:hypothetical protein
VAAAKHARWVTEGKGQRAKEQGPGVSDGTRERGSEGARARGMRSGVVLRAVVVVVHGGGRTCYKYDSIEEASAGND